MVVLALLMRTCRYGGAGPPHEDMQVGKLGSGKGVTPGGLRILLNLLGTDHLNSLEISAHHPITLPKMSPNSKVQRSFPK